MVAGSSSKLSNLITSKHICIPLSTHKIDITYTIAKENTVFSKMGALCELQERHGVDLGSGYKNEKV